MSVGSIIGGAVGAIAGFFLGGPYGAWVGFTIGYGIGAMIDPLTPDMNQAGQPAIGALAVTTAEEGMVLPDVLGTTKLLGNIVWYCCDRSEEITEEVETGGKGGGGSQTVVTGHQYFLTWAEVVCLGPVDTIYTIYANDDVVWEGELNRPTISGGQETITLDDMGAVTVYFGTDDHVANSTIGANLEDDTLNTPYRNQCWFFYNDCKIGDYNRSPTMKYILKKSPEIPALIGTAGIETINEYDYNPAHAVWYILETMTGLSDTFLDATTFSGASETLKQEERGISMLFSQYQTAETYIDTILSHIGGILKPTSDGSFGLKLIRADATVSGMETFTAGPDLVNNYDFTRKSWLDTGNEYKIQYAQRVFRAPVCPHHSEGYVDTGVSGIPEIGIDPGTTYELIINNEESQEYFGLDCNSDFMFDEAGGTFGTPTRNEDGSWTIPYTSAADLCSRENCPIIFEQVYPCCDCATAETLEWAEGNPETIAVSNSAVVSVEGGLAQYFWTVDGTGFWLDQSFTTKILTTTGKSVTVYTDGSACGGVEIDVVDACSSTTGGSLRAPSGGWVLVIDRNCGIINNLGGCLTQCGDNSSHWETMGAHRYSQAWYTGTRINEQYLGIQYAAWSQVPFAGSCGPPWQGGCSPPYGEGCPGYHFDFCIKEYRPGRQREWEWRCP